MTSENTSHEETKPGIKQRMRMRGRNAWNKTRRIAAVIYVLAIVILIGIIVFFVYQMVNDGDEVNLSADTTLNCVECERVLVTGVTEGDALDTNLGRVRMHGADTPASGEDCYTESVDAMRELAGSVVRGEAGPELTDPFDNRIFYLYTESGRSIDELLIRNGLAFTRLDDGQHREFLLGVEREAAAADRGCLWN